MPRSSTDASPSRALVEAALRGDRVALPGLLERHLPGLRTYVRLRHGPRLRALESSSDVVQSVCREVLEELDRFEFESEGRFRQWLFRVAERKILERARFWNRQRRDPRRLAPAPAHTGSGDGAAGIDAGAASPSEIAMAREQLEDLETAFAGLSPEHQEVILLSRVVGLSHREVARRMGRSEGATRTLLFRALACLTSLMRGPRRPG